MVLLEGDGRCNSPVANYCIHTLLVIDSCTIIHVETVDMWEVSLHSPNMEREAVRQAIRYIHTCRRMMLQLIRLLWMAYLLLRKCWVSCIMLLPTYAFCINVTQFAKTWNNPANQYFQYKPL